MTRVTAPEISRPPQLTPAPLPSDTYVPPPRQERGQDLERLAQALGTFGAAVQSYSHLQDIQQAKLLKEHEAEVRSFIAANTDEGLKKAIDEGRAPFYADPRLNLIYQKRIGEAASEAFRNHIQTQLAEGKVRLTGLPDQPEPDLQKFIIEEQQKFAGLPAENLPVARTVFAQGVTQLRDGLLLQQQKARSEQTVQLRVQSAADAFMGIMQRARQEGTDPDTVAGMIRSAYKELGPGSVVALDNKQLDDILINVAKQTAQAYPEYALAILNRERLDEKGNSLGRLADVNRHYQDVKEIASTATRALSKRDKAAIETQLAGVDIQAFERADGSFGTLTDHLYTDRWTGERDRIGAEDRKKDAVANYLTRSKATPGDRFEREFRVFTGNGVAHPEWKEALEGTVRATANGIAQSDPQGAQRLEGAAKLYLTLRDRNAPYLTSLVDQKTRDFYETYHLLTQKLGRTPVQAAADAAQAIRDPASEEEANLRRIRANEIDRQAKNLKFGGDWFNPWSGVRPENQAHVAVEIGKVAQVFGRVRGVEPDEAVKQAAEAVRKNGVVFNGQFLIGRDAPPKDAVPALTRLLADTWKTHQKLLTSEAFKEIGVEVSGPQDLSIRPKGGGVFEVITKNGVPLSLPRPDGGRGVPQFTPADIHAARQTMEREKLQTITDGQKNNRPKQWFETPTDPLIQKQAEEGQKRKAEEREQFKGVMQDRVLRMEEIKKLNEDALRQRHPEDKTPPKVTKPWWEVNP